mgnify:CR=1 FL=1
MLAGVNFVGQTEYLSALGGTERTAMMLLGQDDRGRWLRVALAITHVPLKLVSERLTAEKIELAIELASQACQDLGLSRARVGVCGLNPHAGESGKLGREEIDIIAPAVQELNSSLVTRLSSLVFTGPISPDTVFYRATEGEFNAVLCMYHDQGLIPLKLHAFHHGVNGTLGLPFPRTSPDHGTAFDIAGKGIAKADSMIAAINLAVELASGA